MTDRHLMLAGVIVALVLAPMASGEALDPEPRHSVYLRPCAYDLTWGVSNYCDVMNSQRGVPTLELLNNSGGAAIPLCGIDKFSLYLQSYDDRGVLLLDSHGDGQTAAAEAYRNRSDRESAWLAHAYAGWDTTKLNRIDHPPEVYGIGLKKEKIAGLWQGGHQELVLAMACRSMGWAATAFPDARCVIGCRPDIDCYSDQMEILLNRLDGQQSPKARIVALAMDGLRDTLAASGSEETNLAPRVTNVSPLDGDQVSWLANGSVDFDSQMYTELAPYEPPITASGPATVWGVHWSANQLLFTLQPYCYGDITLTLTLGCVSASGTWLDGNQNPPDGRNAVGPAGVDDAYVWHVTSTYCDVNPSAFFDGSWAFPSADSTHVLWVSDPEIGSLWFDVWGGPDRQQLLATVPAVGGLLPHYYEIATPPGWSRFEVVERDADPMSEDCSTGPFDLSSAPPENLADLRALNDVVAQWPEPQITPIENFVDNNRDTTPVDFVFYTGRADFLPAICSIRDRLAQEGWTGKWVWGTSDPNQARAAFRGAYEDAVAANYWHLPMCVIVGEANVGDHPERNVVGTFYTPEEGQGCLASSCASDLEMTNFFGAGPECPYTRVVASTVAELTNCVNSTLEYYDNVNVSDPRVEMLVGDRATACPFVQPPSTIMDQVQALYSAKGIPVIRRNASDYPCGSVSVCQPIFCADMNQGVTEVVGTGRYSNRWQLPGKFCQKVVDPVFNIADLTRQQRVIFELPGCGMGDTDGSDPSWYPSLAKTFLTNDPNNGTSAVVWLAHSRNGWEQLHHTLARAYFTERVNGQFHWAIQEVYWSVIRKLWIEQPGMRAYLKQAMAFGFPVQLPGFLTPSEVQASLPGSFEIRLTSAPNPGRAPTIRYDLPGLARVQVTVYSVAGRLVRTLVSGERAVPPGRYAIEWDGKDEGGRQVAGGMYFARLDVDGRCVASRKLVIVE